MVKYIDADGSGEIDMKEFVTKLQQLIYKSYPKDRWMVTKTHFMQAVIEQFYLKKDKDKDKL